MIRQRRGYAANLRWAGIDSARSDLDTPDSELHRTNSSNVCGPSSEAAPGRN